MNKIIIFGAGENAEVADYYFRAKGDYSIAAFVVDDEFFKAKSFCKAPLVPASELQKSFPPTKVRGFVAVGYSKMNQLRREKYFWLKSLSYDLVSYISPSCYLFTENIGENCFILEANVIQPFVTIGNNVVLWSGNHIGHHTSIGDHCFITSHVVISGGVKIHENSFIGVNATIRDHVTIERDNLIAAGALIVHDTQPGEMYKSEKAQLASKPSLKVAKI